MSRRSKYLREATRWIQKLDVLADTSEAGLHVYRVQNRNASELAKVLESILQTGYAGQQSANDQMAPKYLTGTVTSDGAEVGGQITGGPETPATGIDVLPSDTELVSLAQSPATRRIRVVADDANFSLLIHSSRPEFECMASLLLELDTVPNQVLLEAVIAEVSLDDDQTFGVRRFLGEKTHGTTFSDALSGAVSSVFPGFSYFLKPNDIAFTLKAVSRVTNVQVLSAPSLVVLDNRDRKHAPRRGRGKL